ncbi:endogenous inhibitor of DNA gyrase (YacG/DUF329 family) [Halorubrum alkaliphilum]|uniref:Endogenous inhibitor of DNA gyrase (YacG/DUF329 family) n=1 Tax=Halorubrum alkaliphilum TaxID=261290 RepID=A0A8T4GGH0_9EURY|nr:zinc ribbon domain-containing protein [Halorubrum alkaliphilum]MBP1922817.1 endogenous inhibitor of DNA gyrase (YacG/DUF329 family) [Halorubrum alkaliphilum]
MSTVEFTCSGCGQTIEVNDEMRETILSVGCPVCTTPASDDDFAAPDEDDAATLGAGDS